MSKNNLNKRQVAEIISNFIEGTGKDWDWDDFISIPIDDKYLDSIRIRCAGLPEEFPPSKGDGYSNKKGLEVLQEYFNKLSK